VNARRILLFPLVAPAVWLALLPTLGTAAPANPRLERELVALTNGL
jgi:hypothetical protein